MVGDELTKTAAGEGGKPYADSKVEVLRAINGVKVAAEHIGQLYGTEVPMGLTKSSENRVAYTRREPIGVVASVSAFNHLFVMPQTPERLLSCVLKKGIQATPTPQLIYTQYH